MNHTQSNSKNSQTGQPNSHLEQRIWVKEQEVTALKVQNRHLLAKLEEAENSARPNQVNTQLIAIEVQKSLQPVMQELEKSIKGAFEILQSTMRGIYQQSQRCQQAVEEIGAHSRDIEVRVNEQRKSDQVFFQEKIITSVTAFCDRMERQIENRLKALSVVELLNTKQNEMLNDVDQMKAMIAGIHKNSDSNRADLSRIEKDTAEVSQKIIEVQVQANNSEELSRDVLQQVQNHRAEFKLLRGELRSIMDNTSKLSEKLGLNENDVSLSGDDLTSILDSIRSRKNELKRAAKESENRLRELQEQDRAVTAANESTEASSSTAYEVQEIRLNPVDNQK